MPKNTQRADDDPDGADESLYGARIEMIDLSPSSEPDQPDQVDPVDLEAGSSHDGSLAAPSWTKRLSTRGKLARALITMLVVLVALIALLPLSNSAMPAAVARLLTPAPTQTPRPAALTTGPWEASRPLVSVARVYTQGGAGVQPQTAYTARYERTPVQHDTAFQLMLSGLLSPFERAEATSAATSASAPVGHAAHGALRAPRPWACTGSVSLSRRARRDRKAC
jgi:hypothetical protein